MRFVCDICDKTFNRRQHFHLHFARNHTDKEKWEHRCKTCGKCFAALEILERHQTNHDENYQIACGFESCSKTFHSMSALNKHRRTFHVIVSNQTKKYVCNVESCGASFTKHHILKQHSFIHTGIPPFKCEKCEKQFKTASHKTRHEKVHDGYPCSQCQTTFETWSKLREHVSIAHPKTYKCIQCDKSFSMKCRLTEHLQVHKNERRVFKCKECDSTFVKKGNLKVHVKTVHLQEKNFICKKCNKSFAHQSSLQKHEKSHDENNNIHKSPIPKKQRKFRKDKLSLVSRITGFNPNKAIISAAVL